ncbi:MAG: endonuclease MutS2 [bacterium]
MNVHSLRVLELDKVRDAVIERTTWAGGARRAGQLAPLREASAVAARLALISEVRRVLEESDIPVHGLPDLAEALAEAEPDGAILPGARIAPIARSLRIVQTVASFLFEWREKVPGLYGAGRGLSALGELRESIDRQVDGEGRVRDDATPALRKIRREQERVREKIHGVLRRLAHSLAAGGAEPVITLRNDRYVISVRRDRLQGLSGVVHGQSSTGQSVYLEPAAAMEGNNELAELRSAEDEETLRILAELTTAVRTRLPELRTNQEILAELDMLRAAGRLSRDLDAVPALASERGMVLRRARHPVLQMQLAGSGNPVVPLDLELGGARPAVLVITGPNTGGKTVALKTVGLLALMNQSGLHVPAGEGTRIPLYSHLVADIGDEQSIEQSLSTFSSHMAHVIDGLRRADAHTLVLLDELGVGTDPEEGAALGKAILSELARVGASGIVTTHYGALKIFAHENAGMENASLEFDRETLSPTYRFLQGVPGSSEGLSIAKRLGFPEPLVEEARSYLGTEREAVDGLLRDLQERRRELEARVAEVAAQQAEARELSERVEKRLRGLAEERARVKQEALEEARRLVERSKAELSELLGAVREDGREGRASGRARTRLGEMANEIDRSLAETARETDRAGARRPARPQDVDEGTPVMIASMGWKGTALGPPSANGKVSVSVGSLRVDVPLSALELRAPDEPRRVRAVVERPEGTVATEIDLRGRTVEEALLEVDRTLDGLVVSGGTWVRIIHGKGTGALRNAITEQLKGDPRVKEFRMGQPNEGGTGVTVAVLK